MKKHILLIGGWNEILQIALKKYEVSYIGTFQKSDSFNPSILKKCAYTKEANISEVSTCLYFANIINNKKSLSAVTSFTEYGIQTASIISDNLKVPGLGIKPTYLSSYKNLMRKELADDLELSLPFKNLDCEQTIKIFFKKHCKIILKPISGAGSKGIVQIKDKITFDKFIKKFNIDDFKDYIIEKFIDSSKIYSVETISKDGKHCILNTALEYVKGNINPYINKIIVPAPDLDDAKKSAIKKLVDRFLTKIGVTNEISHTEIIFDGNKPYIIETQLRVGGARIWKMNELTTKISQIELELDNLSSSIKLPSDYPKTHSVCMILKFIPDTGKVAKICGYEKLLENKNILNIDFKIKQGDFVKKPKNNDEIKSMILLQAKSYDELLKLANEISQKIWIEYENGKKCFLKIL